MGIPEANQVSGENNINDLNEIVESTKPNVDYEHCEKLALYPTESQQIITIDLYDDNSKVIQTEEPNSKPESNDLNLVSSSAASTSSPKFSQNTSNEKCSQILIDQDETMMFEDFELISTKTKKITEQTLNLKQAVVKNDLITNQLQIDKLKSGLTAANSLVPIDSSKENFKEMTISQLYLAFNKPSSINLKYDWVSNCSCSHTNPCFPLSVTQNQQQRFYLNALASVASAFLNELQTQTNTTTQKLNREKEQQQKEQQQQPIPAPVIAQTKSPPKQLNPVQNIQSPSVSHHNIQSLAIIQPSISNKATILPFETVLQRLTEEQNNKTKKLLSDLNSKRRPRPRKQLMVVNNSNSNNQTRNIILPKFNFMNGQQFIVNVDRNNSPEINTQGLQKNIVLSGPVPAIARQIVNNSPQTFITSDNGAKTSQNSNLNIIHENYSNLFPNIINGLIDSNSNSNNDEEKSDGKNNYEGNLSLTDMSLLELTITNSDSFFNKPSTSETSDDNQINLMSDGIELDPDSSIYRVIEEIGSKIRESEQMENEQNNNNQNGKINQ